MKNYLKLFIVSLALIFLGNSCGEEPFDIKDGGTSAANLYVTSAVKFFVGNDTNVEITYEKFENPGATIQNINYTVVLKSTLGTSAEAPGSAPASGTSITIPITDLLASVPVDGNVLTEGDLVPGDTFTFNFAITLGDGTVLNTTASSVVTVQCRPESGSYRVAMHDSYGDGWQTDDNSGGAGLQVTLDDGTVLEVGMCSPYAASSFTCAPGDFEAEDFIVIPAGTESADWYFPGDAYGEISFEIFAPGGAEIFASGTPGAQGAGLLPIINCE